MAWETSKATTRRLREPNFALRYFVGRGLDVGAGTDSLEGYRHLFHRMEGVSRFDLVEGDAQYLNGIVDEIFDFVHSSHCLEHLVDPMIALSHWYRVLKPGGHLIVTVPDEDLYEQGEWPSTWNSDHKWSFHIAKEASFSEQSLSIVKMLHHLKPLPQIKKIALIDDTYEYGRSRFDQTLGVTVEASIEFVVRKPG